VNIKNISIFSFFAGLVARLLLVFKLPLWIDEVFTYNVILKPFSAVLNWNTDIVHPPGYYFFLKIFFLINHSYIWLRLITIIFYIFSCYFLYKLGKTVKDKNARYFLVIAYCLSGYSIIFDWQIRAYAMVTTLIICILYLYTEKYSIQKLFAISFLNLIGLFFDYGFIWFSFPFLLFSFYKSLSAVKNNKDKNKSIFFLLSMTVSCCIFLIFWLINAKDFLLKGIKQVGWIYYYIKPSFFIPYFLGAAHGFFVFTLILFSFLVIGIIYLLKNSNKVIFFIVISSGVILYTIFLFSVFIMPILHVRNLQMIGLSVIFIYAYFFCSLIKNIKIQTLFLTIYLLNFLLTVYSIFLTPAKFLLKFY